MHRLNQRQIRDNKYRTQDITNAQNQFHLKHLQQILTYTNEAEFSVHLPDINRLCKQFLSQYHYYNWKSVHKLRSSSIPHRFLTNEINIFATDSVHYEKTKWQVQHALHTATADKYITQFTRKS